MIHQTPKQNEEVINSNWPTIRSSYQQYEVTFVLLHPFLQIEPGSNIVFETGSWPTKAQIIAHTKGQSWANIIRKADLKDISELDRLIAYLHCARRTADKTAWVKLKETLKRGNYIAAEVDSLPEILINDLFGAIKSLGYSTIDEYTEFGEFGKTHIIDNMIESDEREFYVHARLITPDNKIVIATDFDQRFSYLSSTRQIIGQLIELAGLEGFYCEASTRADWSYIEQKENLIDWNSPERYMNYI